MSKVCIIGLDGATFTVIDHLTAQGRLPNFTALLGGGSRATLLSSVPPITPAAWASFYCGTNPGKNGTVDFFKWQPGSYRLSPTNATTVSGSPLWVHASNHGRRVCVYNVPVTYPAAPVNGILISGMDAPHLDEQAVHPSGFRETLLEWEPDFKFESAIDFKFLVNNSADPTGECIRLLNEQLQLEIRVIRKLMAEEDWDLFMAVFRSPDAFQHLFWRSVEAVVGDGGQATAEDVRRAEAVFSCYETIDAELGEIAAGRSTNHPQERDLVLMSDHGFGLLKREVCLNRVLAEAGLLKFLPVSGKKKMRNYLVGKLQAGVSRETRKKIKKMMGKDNTKDTWNLFVDALVADIDWSQTQLASIGQFGCIFANIKGRDPLGTIEDEAELAAVLDRAEAALKALRDPIDGKRVVTRIYRRGELYSGPLAGDMPDMVVVMRDYEYRGIYSTRFELSHESLIRPPRDDERKELAHSGTHRREGMLMLAGRDIRHNDLGTVEMVDVAPTVANLLGLPPLEEYDGRILAEAYAAGAAHDIEGGPGAEQAVAPQKQPPAAKDEERLYSEEDEEEVRKRLSDLGYL